VEKGFRMTHKILGLLIGGLTLAASASPAVAATVSVQIESAGQALAPTVVHTPATVNKDGANACDGASVLGALDAATAGNWNGSYSVYQGKGNYVVNTVRGEAHDFGSGAYWSMYVNNRFQNDGTCLAKVRDGDEVLIFASDDPFTAGTGGYDEPVVLSAPATVAPGQPFGVSVKDAVTSYDANYEGTTAFSPAAGATVTGGGATGATAADGTATLTLADRGPVMLTATEGNRVPDRATVCVTDGADGFCGTTRPDGTTVPGGGVTQAICRTSGDDGRCGSADKHAAYGFISSVKTGRHYAKGKGPRELTGRVDDEPSGISDIRLRLTRNDGGRCAAFDGKREAFVKLSRCGATRGGWFSAGTIADWRYLLPAKLSRGRYVLDVQVVDKAGNRDDKLARGRNRVVFFVD
jgi:hypothetical protein